MERHENQQPIAYDVRVPALRKMSEEKRAQALEDYIRENSRQLRLILTRLTEMIENIEKRAE